MKICYLTRIFPPRVGGPGTLTHLIGTEMMKRGHDVTVVTQNKGDAPKYQVINGMKIHRTFCFENEFTVYNLSISTLLYIKKVLSQLEKNDMFQAMDISIAGFGGYIAKHFSKKPFFLHYSGDLVFEFLSLKSQKNWDPKKGVVKALKQKSLIAKILLAVQNGYMKNYDVIIPDSEFGGRLLLEKLHVPKEKVKVIVNGVDTEKFKPANKEAAKKKLGLNGRVVLTATRLVPWKGIDILIKSMPAVLKEIPDAHLMIAGEGIMYDRLRILAESLKLNNNVKLLGRVPEDLMPLYMKACDVYALPSFFDTVPNILLEIMSSGKPTVVSDIDGLREVINDKTSIKIPVGDHEVIAEKLVEVLSSPKKMRSMGAAARKTILKNYSREKMIDEHAKLYDSWSS